MKNFSSSWYKLLAGNCRTKLKKEEEINSKTFKNNLGGLVMASVANNGAKPNVPSNDNSPNETSPSAKTTLKKGNTENIFDVRIKETQIKEEEETKRQLAKMELEKERLKFDERREARMFEFMGDQGKKFDMLISLMMQNQKNNTDNNNK